MKRALKAGKTDRLVMVNLLHGLKYVWSDGI